MPKPRKTEFDSKAMINIQRVDADVDTRSSGTLFGNIGDKMLIFGEVRSNDLAVGQELIVRMIKGREIMGFKTTILEISQTSERLYLMDYPETVERVNLREAPRLNVFFPAEIEARVKNDSSTDIHLLKAMVLNMSKGGCLFSSKRHVGTGDEISISFSLPGEKLILKLNGRVVERSSTEAFLAQRIKYSDSKENIIPVGDISRWFNENYQYAMTQTAT